MVTLPAEDEERIVRYLLDEMGEEERFRLEDRLFHEPELFELVHSVEYDLILKFVRGDLDSQASSRFSEVYVNAPAKRARVESARVWRQAAAEIAAASRFRPTTRFWFSLSVAAATAVILLVLLFPFQRQRPAVQQFAPTPENISSATFVLEPGLTRSRGGVEIKVPPGTDVIRLQLALPYPAGDAETYHVVVGTPERPAVWNGPALRDQATVVASLPAQVLVAGDYTVELQANRKDVGTYTFRVAK